MNLIGKLSNTAQKYRAGVDMYRLALYGCIIGLFTLPLLEKLDLVDAKSYTLALAVCSIFFLGKLGRSAAYSKQIKADSLTGLVSREGFVDALDVAIARYKTADTKSPVVALVIDVHNFKHVNESLGHLDGDKLLKLIGVRLSGLVSERDVVSRLGNDEYAILLNSASIGYLTFAEKIYAAFFEPFKLTEDLSLTVGISMGMSSYPEHSDSALTLLRSASIALQTSKKSKMGFKVYDAGMDRGNTADLSLASDLRHAVENEEFVFHYQPQLNLKTGQISGVEALIRWKHPTLGLIRPDRFIPMAEQSNQISLLTSWTLRQGISTLSKFRNLGYNITLSINISPYALINSDILIKLTKEIVYHSIPYKSLIVEITESSIDKSPEDMAKIIACLDMLGIQLSIDDFGTGHASLLYLKHLPIKEIKVDKGFVSNMLTNSADASIVQATIDLAHGIGCEVVAEGVETEEVLEKLRELGCDVIQGYIVAKPLIEDDLLALLDTRNERDTNCSELINV